MGLLIKGATGKTTEVNPQGQIVTESMAKSAFAKASENGDAYSWTAVTENLAATGTALCVVNQSRDRLLCITKVYSWADVPTALQIHCPAAGTWAGTAVVGVNYNRHSMKTADAVAYANETGQTLAAGTVILSLENNEATADEFGCKWDFEGAVILGYDDSIAVDVVVDSATFNCTIEGYYIDI